VLNFVKPACSVLILISCLLSCPKFRSSCPVYVWWVFTVNKLAKTSMVLLTVLDEIPDVCNSCFKVTLTSLDSRSCNQGEGIWAFSPSWNFQKHFQLLRTASSYKHFAPMKISAWYSPVWFICRPWQCFFLLKLMGMLMLNSWEVSCFENLQIAYCKGLQTTACRPNTVRKAISSGPWRHFVNEKRIYLRKICWFGRM